MCMCDCERVCVSVFECVCVYGCVTVREIERESVCVSVFECMVLVQW